MDSDFIGNTANWESSPTLSPGVPMQPELVSLQYFVGTELLTLAEWRRAAEGLLPKSVVEAEGTLAKHKVAVTLVSDSTHTGKNNSHNWFLSPRFL